LNWKKTTIRYPRYIKYKIDTFLRDRKSIPQHNLKVTYPPFRQEKEFRIKQAFKNIHNIMVKIIVRLKNL